ncbi:DUF445 domain-containing protein [Aquirhabdus sp.]|uniref:DUF445 domain-containing protein n=1 Tax=Aquirhabdus sp. TaxID=2824160 RepID=UPI00396CE2EE
MNSLLSPELNLSRNKRIATVLLVTMVVIWLILLFSSRFFPQYNGVIHILTLGAEAGVVGGLADWYAITVLFRDPFKHIWVPKFIREHTEIIPRNKARIAESMGRFVQENFLAPQIVRNKLEAIDMSLYVANWLAEPANAKMLSEELKRLVPRFLKIAQNETINQFIKQSSIQWLSDTPINQAVARTMKAVFDNKIHQDVISLILNSVDNWIHNNPEYAEEIIQKILDETGVFGHLSRGATILGFDVKRNVVWGVLRTVRDLNTQPDHHIHLMLNHSIAQWMTALEDDNSEESQKLETFKQSLVQSPTVVAFGFHIYESIMQGIIEDLQSEQSAISRSLQGLMMRIGNQLASDIAVRQALNHEIAQFAEYAANRYADTVIQYISEQIHNWDTRDMIGKIESEVGGDLHMIRVNGVVVGFMIGIILGLVRFAIEGIG